MSAYLNTFRAGLTSAITAALPEVEARNVWPAEQIERVALEKLVNEDRLPMVVIDIVQLTEADGPIAALSFDAEVSFYIFQRDPATSNSLITRLETLRDYLKTNDPPEGQVFPGMRISWSPFLSPLDRSISKQLNLICGMVGARFRIGEL